MALNKHQRLARAMKSLLKNLDMFHDKVAEQARSLHLYFYEKYLIAGRPLMTERAVAAMVSTHRLGLSMFSPNRDLREAASSNPLIGMILSPPLYLRSQVYYCSNANEKTLWFIPWGVKTQLPSENLKKLEESKLEDILYCASEDEMSEWIDWFEEEDKAGSYTNQLLAIGQFYQERDLFESNLQCHCFPGYKKAILDFHGKIKGPKVYKTLIKTEFAPNEDSNIYEAYQLVTAALRNRKKRHFKEFQRFWKGRLLELVFAKLTWPLEKQEAFLMEYFPEGASSQKETADPRWESSRVLDRQTYGMFLYHFINRFINDPLENQVDGEIALLFWIMIYAARDLKKVVPVKSLLTLTTKDVADRLVTTEGGEVEISCGFADLIKEYTGGRDLQRQQKLFPSLTIDKIEDRFRKASEVILPPGATPALPEAFLIFPHREKGCRMAAQARRRQLQTPPVVIHDPISRRELSRQLVEAAKQNLS